jgi:hypothetical protein
MRIREDEKERKHVYTDRGSILSKKKKIAGEVVTFTCRLSSPGLVGSCPGVSKKDRSRHRSCDISQILSHSRNSKSVPPASTTEKMG